MIKMFFASTTQIDDPEAAADEILTQLDLNKNLLKNAVGIVTFHSEIVKSGILGKRSQLLPFRITGISTLSSAIRHNHGQFILTLTVLTSDDTVFAAGVSSPLEGDQVPALSKLYGECTAQLPGKPSFAISFFPLCVKSGVAGTLKELNDIACAAPIFGAVAIDYGVYIRNPLVSFGGEVYKDALSLILFCGDVRPSYRTQWQGNALNIKGTAFLTKTSGNTLLEINGMPAADYLYTSGILEKGDYITQSALFIITESNEFETPSCMAMFGPLDNGGFLCEADVPQGLCVSIALLDKKTALDITSAAASTLKEKTGGVMIFSCVVYNLILELAPMEGIKTVSSILDESVPYLFTYAAGEICPAKTSEGGYKNRLNNMSIITLSFD
jgi:hypothetical protein